MLVRTLLIIKSLNLLLTAIAYDISWAVVAVNPSPELVRFEVTPSQYRFAYSIVLELLPLRMSYAIASILYFVSRSHFSCCTVS